MAIEVEPRGSQRRRAQKIISMKKLNNKIIDSYLDFFLDAGELKKTKRTGWILRGVKNPESLADHVFRTTLMTLVLGAKRKEFDFEKLLITAITHELPEIFAGDATPYDQEKNQKESLKKWIGYRKEYLLARRKNEFMAMKKLLKDMEPEEKKGYLGLWADYSLLKSKEAKFVHQVEKLELLLQAIEYQLAENDFPIEPFWEDVDQSLKDKQLRKFFDRIGGRFRDREIL